MKHTKGPWNVKEAFVVSGAQTICMVNTTTRDNHRMPREANADLIAAAPEMLEALKRAVPWIGKLIADGAHLNSVLPKDAEIALDMMEAVIARAEGVKHD